MSYIDGFILPVKAAKKGVYLEMAKLAATVFRECGALEVVECWGDDVPQGKLTSYPLAVKLEADEVVVFSWVIWPSKAARDEGNAKFMSDPRMAMNDDMPFDGKRMIFGGFELLNKA